MKVITDQTKNYSSAFEALQDQGFTHAGTFRHVDTHKKYSLWKKDGQTYAYNGMSHFNTTIYSVSLTKRIPKSENLY